MWLALDIGGANIKSADGRGYCAIEPFALWRQPDRLSETLRKVIDTAPPCERIAATMTGELADCFQSKAEGVVHILDAHRIAADGRRIARLSGRWTVRIVARSQRRTPLSVAAANWHALASFAGRFVKDETALLIDIGSTTTDVIPLVDGLPRNQGKTDTQRLLCGELVYTGVERSPVCAVVGHLPYRGQLCPVAQELFATTWDAYLIVERTAGRTRQYEHGRRSAGDAMGSPARTGPLPLCRCGRL